MLCLLEFQVKHVVLLIEFNDSINSSLGLLLALSATLTRLSLFLSSFYILIMAKLFWHKWVVGGSSLTSFHFTSFFARNLQGIWGSVISSIFLFQHPHAPLLHSHLCTFGTLRWNESYLNFRKNFSLEIFSTCSSFKI